MECNAFEQCKWLRHLGKVMILIVMGLVGLSAWAVLIDVYYPAIQSKTGSDRVVALALASLFTYLICMIMWCYFVTVFRDPGSVPAGWTPFPDNEDGEEEFESLAQRSTGVERLTGSSRPRFCRKCNAWKPPRAHHDSVSGKCVLKMDHYCVWVINTVGLLNYKAFMLFLWYTFLASLMGVASLARPFVTSLFIDPRSNTPIPIYIAFVLDISFTLALAGFIIMHIRLISANCTTIEMYEKRRVPLWPYDKGLSRNFMEVFGSRIFYWSFPVMSKEEEESLLAMSLGSREDGLTEQLSLKGAVIEL